MPNPGHGTKDFVVQTARSNPTTESTSKKKRPRQRNRVRNKNYKSPAAAACSCNPETGSALLQQNTSPILLQSDTMMSDSLATCAEFTAGSIAAVGKSRDEVMAERESKKLAKQAKKTKTAGDACGNKITIATTMTTTANENAIRDAPGKPQEASTQAIMKTNQNTAVDVTAAQMTHDEVKAKREAKKLAKLAKLSAKVIQSGGCGENVESCAAALKLEPQVLQSQLQEEKKKPVLTKGERRAIQEAQRAAKAQVQQSSVAVAKSNTAPHKPFIRVASAGASTRAEIHQSVTLKSAASASLPKVSKTPIADCKVKLFNHLDCAHRDVSRFINNLQIHPSIARLGEQYAKRTIVGSNARCIAFLSALKMVIQDFETPPKKEFSRSLEVSITNCVEHLQQCRPLAVSVSNAYKHIKHVLTQLPTDKPESQLKENLCHFIDTYVENQIGKAAQAISSSMQEKIINGDVILTFGCSSLINYICEEAHRRHVNFRVIVVDSRPFCEGQELLRRLTSKEIPCTYVLINAVGFVMPEATKVLLGAHALLSNGYVMARTGTAQVALVARSFNVPVLVCCETHKFSERFQTDAIVYNELGNPDDLVLSEKCCLTNWKTKGKMMPLNLIYDITPPELVTAVVTEVSILPCTSVPVILRIKPTEIGYYS